MSQPSSPFSLWMLPGLQSVPAWPPVPPAPQPPPCLHRLQAGPVQVYLLSLPPDPEPWIAQLSPCASGERRARAARFRFPVDALRCLAAEALLRHALLDQHGLPAAAIECVADPGGKPRLLGQPDIHFNLSHSGPWVLCALHRERVGVDVEEVRLRDGLPAKIVMSPEEFRHFERLAPLPARDYFYRLWTLKESLLKAMGTGLSLAPDGITLDLAGPAIRAAHGCIPLARWQLRELPMPEGARAALCHS